ncbi:MAG: PadR family transcriptional regulator [Desulfurococcales archaeon]|nr:PadR family transcriptional regulator [Desulfurococcales archaeon]
MASKLAEPQKTKTADDIVRESLRNLTIRILAEKPMHGYEIMKKIEEITNGRWRPAAGTLYPLIEQLKREGLIDVEKIEDSKVRGGRRIIYKLTNKGWRVLAELIRTRAEGKLVILKYYIFEGALLLKERGLKKEYEEIMDIIKRELGNLASKIDLKCYEKD